MIRWFRALLEAMGLRPRRRRRRRRRSPARVAAGRTIRGRARVIDGDTIEIRGIRIRLAGIDAPELSHPWGRRAKAAMTALCGGRTITARVRPGLSYGRHVATCRLPDGRDLAAIMVRRGLALDWARYSGGAYRKLEPFGARLRLRRAAAKQRKRTRRRRR